MTGCVKTFCYGGPYHGRKIELSGHTLVVAKPVGLPNFLIDQTDLAPSFASVHYSLTKVQNHDWQTDTREYVWALLPDGKDYDPLKIFNMGKRYKLVVRV